jgi:hypothetical protein
MNRNWCRQGKASGYSFLGTGLAFIGVGLSGQASFFWLGLGFVAMAIGQLVSDRRARR